MDFKGIQIYCPACRGELEWLTQGEQLGCQSCERSYPVVCDIPDLRVFPDPYIDAEADRAKGMKVSEKAASVDFEGLIDFYYGVTDVVPPQHAQMYKRGLLSGVYRAEKALSAWEQASNSNGNQFKRLLEIGCGTGPLLVAAKHRYRQVVGVDIAFRWLVVAKKRLDEAGMGDIPLICACAEALPFREDSFDNVVADSVIEHTKSQSEVLLEARRVMGNSGQFFMSTPNRFSIGPDPHTGVPAGSMLPNSVTASLVRMQGGIPPKRRLLSIMSMMGLLKQSGYGQFKIFLPDVPEEQRVLFPSPMKQIIGMYNRVKNFPVTKQMLYLFGPLLYAVAESDTSQKAN